MGVDSQCVNLDQVVEGKEQHEGHNPGSINNKHGVQNNNRVVRSDQHRSVQGLTQLRIVSKENSVPLRGTVSSAFIF